MIRRYSNYTTYEPIKRKPTLVDYRKIKTMHMVGCSMTVIMKQTDLQEKQIKQLLSQ